MLYICKVLKVFTLKRECVILLYEIGESMILIVGLGNIGKEYEHTRHNMGFDVIDKLADSIGVCFDKTGFKGTYVKTSYFDQDLILLKPSTYMNLSGDSVIEVMNFFKINIDDIIVIYDDMDTPIGHIKLKIKGSSGGHNGIKSIIARTGHEDFKRIKVGIGHPTFGVIDYVLNKPSKEEEIEILKAQDNAVNAIKVAIKESFNKAMTMYNK